MVHCVPLELGWVGEGGYVYLCLVGVGWGKGGMFISEVAWVGAEILACILKNQFQSIIFLMHQWFDRTKQKGKRTATHSTSASPEATPTSSTSVPTTTASISVASAICRILAALDVGTIGPSDVRRFIALKTDDNQLK